MTFKDHDLTAPADHAPACATRKLPLRDPAGIAVPGLHAVRITLDNPASSTRTRPRWSRA